MTDRNLTPADVEAIADKTVQKLFEGFGFDISTPEGRLEAQGAFRWLMFCYRGVGIFGRSVIGAATVLITGFVFYKLFGWGGPK